MTQQNAVATITPQPISTALGVADILAQVALIQQVMKEVMQDKEHYGKIPGCGEKNSLFLSGAQKLLMTFRLAPEYEVFQTDIDRGHREYRVQCTLKNMGSGNFVGQGVGCCSTMEGKYRFRVAPKKLTDRDVPKEYWDMRKTDPAKAQQTIGGKGFSVKKDDNGSWKITEGTDEKIEHDNPADYYNTVLKMAKKRALVDATITATAASDIFTQDVEDMPEVIPGAQAKPAEPVPQGGHPTPQPPKLQPAGQPPGTTSEDVGFVSYKEISSKPGAAKQWTGYFCTFERKDGEKFEAGTFSKTIADSFDTLQGAIVTLVHQPGKKEGTREIVSVGPVDDVNF